MAKLSDMKISTQIHSGFGVLVVLLCVLGGGSWFSLHSVSQGFDEYHRLGGLMTSLADAERAFLDARIEVANYANNGEAGAKDKARKHLDAAIRTLETAGTRAGDDRPAVEHLIASIREYAQDVNVFAEAFETAEKLGDVVLGAGAQMSEPFARLQHQVNGANDAEMISQADSAVANALQARIFATRYYGTHKEADGAETLRRLEAMSQSLSAIARRTNDRTIQDLVAQASAARNTYADRVQNHQRAIAEMERLERKRVDVALRVTQEVQGLGKSQADKETRVGEVAAKDMASGQTISIFLALIAVVVGLAAAAFIGRRISAPLTEVAAVIADITRTKNLAKRVEYHAANEIGLISSSFNTLMDGLQEAFQGITQNTGQVAAAAGQASAAVGQVSDGSQNQLNAINQISAAMEQTARAIQDVASNSDSATSNAKKAATMVEHGREKMATMVDVANVISENSKRINQITEVISRIANQTNMLSLNAAIEAARAGEHGKGFAVVAEEVRKLAEHAANSVQQITELVEHAARESQRSLEMVNAVNGDMESIADSVRQTDGLIQGIAAAMTQQASSVEEINANVKNLSKIGETNATAAEEITATMVELARLADQTRRQTQQFNI
ncbi:MAG: methyl-accepting chemotaxis protein [Solirubrobacterales bacterium]